MEDIGAILRDYGGLFALIFILIRETLPLLIKTSLPPIFASRLQREKALIEADQEEREYIRSLEDRQVKAIERISENTTASLQILEVLKSSYTQMARSLEELHSQSALQSKYLYVLLDRRRKANSHQVILSRKPGKPDKLS